jgi:hypothetical protein
MIELLMGREIVRLKNVSTDDDDRVNLRCIIKQTLTGYITYKTY